VASALLRALPSTVSAVTAGSKIVRLSGSCALAVAAIVALAQPVRAEDAPSAAVAPPAAQAKRERAAAAIAAPAPGPRDLPPGQMRFRVLASGEGLRNLVITSIAQDGNGFLWLATDDGVYRFDGDRFAHFSIEAGLMSSAVYVVGKRPDGAICAGSRGGLGCWDGQRFSQETTRGRPGIPIQTMAAFDGKLWVGTDGGGLYVQGDGGEFVPAEGWPDPKASIRALWADADGLVVGDGATVMLGTGNGAWRSIGDVGLTGDLVNAVLRDRHGALWIRTASHMWMLPPGGARATDLSEGLPTGYDVAGVPNGMTIGPRGDVMVGTDVGIAYRDGERWRMIDRSVGMPPGAARSLFVDREGTLWIGSVGLFQLRGRGVIEHYDVASGMPGNIVWGFKRDAEGMLWVGTNRCLVRAVAARWKCVDGTEGRVFRAMVFPPQGGVFAGGSPSDLLYIDPAGKVTSLTDFDRAEDRTILSLALGPEGDLWIGTSLGLHRLRFAVPGRIERVEIPGVRPSGRYAAMAVIDGRLWTATDEGILVLDRGVWHLFNTKAGFRSPQMRRVLRRADGQICASYSEALGVVCFRYDNGAVSAFQHIGPEQGLTTGMAYFLGEDRQQRLWIGTGDGIDVVTAHGIDHFDDSDGLAGNDSAASAFMVDPDGSLWLGSTGGATHVLAQFYDGPPRPPRTAFLSGKVGDHPVINAARTLEVPHDRGALNLEFASSSLFDPKRIEYQNRLLPIETEWSASSPRVARYPALLPGSYRFEVRARIGAGRWGPTTELGFAVLPAWWQTRWFLALLVLAGLATIGGMFALRQHAVLRRRTRQLNERTDASFRAVIDLMPDMISVQRDGKLIYINEASRRFLGVTVPDERWDAIDITARIHPDDLAPVTELFRKVGEVDERSESGGRGPAGSAGGEGARPLSIDTPVSDVIEIRMRGSDGGWRICEVSAVRVDIGGAPTVVSSGRDVTERKRMRAKLLVTDRMASLGTLAAGIAHEINNPLSYVAGNLEAMAETLQLAPRDGAAASERAELSAAVEEARDGAERVRKIVQGLRSFSRSEDQEKRVPLAVAGVLEAAIRLTANQVRHRAQLVRDLGPTPLVVADDGRLTQVFINLLVNAAHAIPEGHSDHNRITVRTRSDDQGRAVIEVADTGKGMAPEVQARVFDPFFTTKDVGEGTGLGLSICHGIISGLGGQISIDSAPDHGTAVRVVLPPAPSEARAPTPAAPVKPASNGDRRHRVMLVDDEPLVVHTIERLLRRDYDITVALCGQEAIEHIAKGVRFDAIVSDVMMPNMTGIELIEEVRRLAPEQADRIIFLSGGAFTAQTRERLDSLGAPQLEKPVTAKELRACVLRVARGSQPP
jgi:signal transduction histidine kinase/ActR/RegA family two-component response regulator